jgi:hypothetical protein
MSRLCGAAQAIICRWVNNYRSCLNDFRPPWAIPFSPVFGDLSVTLLCVSGLESLPDSRRCTLRVAHFTHPYRMAALVLSRCCPGSTTLSSLLHGLSDCLSRYFLHLCYDLLSEMVLELMPCATHSRLWCGFDAVSSRLPSPFSSIRLLSLCC